MKLGYKDNFDEVMERWQSLWRGEMKDKILCQIQVTEEDLPRDPFMRNVPDPEKMFADYKYYHYTRRNLFDDSLPVVAPNFGAGIDGGFLDCQVEFGSGTSWSKPIMENGLKPYLPSYNPENKWVRLIKDALSLYAKSTGEDVVIGPPLHLCSFDLLSLVRGSNILTDIHDHPYELEEMLDKITDFIIAYREDVLSYVSPYKNGYFGGWMHWWFPGSGPCIGDDQLGNCAPDIYERFGYPYHQKLLNRFGGGWFHLHSKDFHLLPQLTGLKNLRCLEISDDPNTEERGFQAIHKIRKLLPDTPLRISCLPEEFLARLRERSLPGNVVYYVSDKDYANINGLSISDANDIMKKVLSYRV